jgi:hypothetical protein
MYVVTMHRNEVGIALRNELDSGNLVSEALADLEILSKMACKTWTI